MKKKGYFDKVFNDFKYNGLKLKKKSCIKEENMYLETNALQKGKIIIMFSLYVFYFAY